MDLTHQYGLNKTKKKVLTSLLTEKIHNYTSQRRLATSKVLKNEENNCFMTLNEGWPRQQQCRRNFSWLVLTSSEKMSCC